jgi:hypothetical protein
MSVTYDTYEYSVASATLSNPGSFIPSGAPPRMQMVLQNVGTATWDSSVRLSYRWLLNGAVIQGFDPNRVMLPTTVPGNSFVTLTFNLTPPPSTAGNLQLQFEMVKEGVFWFNSLIWTPPSPYADIQNFNNGASVVPADESASISGRNLPATLTVQPSGLVAGFEPPGHHSGRDTR